MQLNIAVLGDFFNQVLVEDLGICGDIATNCIIGKDKFTNFRILAKENIVFSGKEIVEWYFKKFSINTYNFAFKDKDLIPANTVICTGYGNCADILLIERTILNFIQHMSGIATTTFKYVEEVKGTKAKIADTRKTIPGLRIIQKYAVTCGGGVNHRLALDSAILIKDNHIAAIGSIKEALNKANKTKQHYSKVIIECDTIIQMKEALENNAEIIMLDNMSVEQVLECVKLNNNRAILEVSGGININNVREYALTGVDLISIGALTHSSKAVDISLDLE